MRYKHYLTASKYLFTALKLNKWGTKPGFIMINNAKFIQIDNLEKINNGAMKNLKLQTADILPQPSPVIELRKRKV